MDETEKEKTSRRAIVISCGRKKIFRVSGASKVSFSPRRCLLRRRYSEEIFLSNLSPFEEVLREDKFPRELTRDYSSLFSRRGSFRRMCRASSCFRRCSRSWKCRNNSSPGRCGWIFRYSSYRELCRCIQ